mgnify:CR=1 FL=1
MSAKWQHRDEGKKVSKRIIKDKSTQDLRKAAWFISSLLGLRKTQKLQKTYVLGTKKALEYTEGSKVYVDYRLDGTATGRLSCAAYTAKKPMGVSFHTLPRDTDINIRSIFTAGANKRFITVDYAAMELRVLAHVAKEKSMQHAFKSGIDLHTYTARLLFGKENISKRERQIAKTVSFLIVYGGGPFNLSETMSIPIERAKEIISNYQRVYPGVFRYMDHVNEFIRENGYAYSIFGRRRNLPDVYSSDRSVINRSLRQGLNFTIQSTASDILLCGLLGISKRFRECSLEARPVATVHDSVEVVCPKEEVEQVINIIYDELVNYPTIKKLFGIEFTVPFGIDIEVGNSFGEGDPVTINENLTSD